VLGEGFRVDAKVHVLHEAAALVGVFRLLGSGELTLFEIIFNFAFFDSLRYCGFFLKLLIQFGYLFFCLFEVCVGEVRVELLLLLGLLPASVLMVLCHS